MSATLPERPVADVGGTTEQFKQWVLDELKDPNKAAELKSRSDEADQIMRDRGLFSPANTGNTQTSKPD